MENVAVPIAFGKYELLERVAVGGMAEVFRARLRAEGGFEKHLVIKRILPHLSNDAEFVVMLIDEAKIAVCLSHPNIVQIYDLGKIEGTYFIAMEFIEGGDLKEILRRCAVRKKHMPVQHAVFIAAEILKGLDYAHTKRAGPKDSPVALQIIHRDISPPNILLSYEGEVKIVDFGIAKASTRMMETAAGILKGKFEYMSPEQASGLTVDARSDLFSTAIILYELLTGRNPFQAMADIEVLQNVRAAKFERPSLVNADIPERLEGIIVKALHRDADKRYSRAAEMRRDLVAFGYEEGAMSSATRLSGFMQELFADDMAAGRSASSAAPGREAASPNQRALLVADDVSEPLSNRPGWLPDEREGWGAASSANPFLTEEAATEAFTLEDLQQRSLRQRAPRTPGGRERKGAQGRATGPSRLTRFPAAGPTPSSAAPSQAATNLAPRHPRREGGVSSQSVASSRPSPSAAVAGAMEDPPNNTAPISGLGALEAASSPTLMSGETEARATELILTPEPLESAVATGPGTSPDVVPGPQSPRPPSSLQPVGNQGAIHRAATSSSPSMVSQSPPAITVTPAEQLLAYSKKFVRAHPAVTAFTGGLLLGLFLGRLVLTPNPRSDTWEENGARLTVRTIEGAETYLNSNHVGSEYPLTISLNPGEEYRVQIVKQGYYDYETRIKLRENESNTLAIPLLIPRE